MVDRPPSTDRRPQEPDRQPSAANRQPQEPVARGLVPRPSAEARGAGPESPAARLAERLLSRVDLAVARTLDRALDERELSVDEAEALFGVHGLELHALCLAADELRRRAVGEVVTYVVNRNVNFTNVCIKRCGFCAFSRGHREEEGYFLPLEEVVRRAKEAWELGATEVCIQAGLPPKMDGSLYLDVCRAIKAELPDMHIHGFSPEEVLYGATRSQCSIEEYLARLKEAGVGSLPGTSAEILDDELRRRISPGRISVADWKRVVMGAHRLGIPTTSTIMYGHVETARHRAAHLALIRDVQKETGGITEFVPLGLIHDEAPMYRKGTVPDVRPGASGEEVVKMHAIARLMLYPHIRNVQVSWVKEGAKLAQWCLSAGANDLGGTLINESISTAAGASHGQLVPPRELRRWIYDADRTPAERTTTYALRRVFADPADDPFEPLDQAAEHPERFGSYFELIHLDRFRFKDTYRSGQWPDVTQPLESRPRTDNHPSADHWPLTTGHCLALAGGVGGAKLALGLSRVLRPQQLTVVVNTGDDELFHGLHVSPDLDTVVYTLAGVVNPETGWGLHGDTFRGLAVLEQLGAQTWFRLGDRDLAVHIRRTELLRQGWTLSEVTRELCRALRVAHAVAPMSDQPVRTIAMTDEGALAFQEYFVRRACRPRLRGLRLEGAERAQPSPGFRNALEQAEALIFCPSNPFVSIGPILAVPGVREQIERFRGLRVVVSPIIGGQAVKGPAAKMFVELGEQPSCVAVARRYQGLCDVFVLDEVDAEHADEVAALGMRPLVLRTLMLSDHDKVRLAREILAAARAELNARPGLPEPSRG